MKSRKKLLKYGMIALIGSAIFSGCGGSSDSGNDNNTALNSGYFIDAPVQGLEYKTQSGIEGVTDQSGRFEYRAGEKISFKIGKLEIGEALPDSDGLVTPDNIQNISQSQRILLMRLLQALDSDDNPANGITIPQEVVTYLSDLPEEKRFSEISDQRQLMELHSDFAREIDEDDDDEIDVSDYEAEMHYVVSKQKWYAEHKEEDDTQSKENDMQNDDNNESSDTDEHDKDKTDGGNEADK